MFEILVLAFSLLNDKITMSDSILLCGIPCGEIKSCRLEQIKNEQGGIDMTKKAEDNIKCYIAHKMRDKFSLGNISHKGIYLKDVKKPTMSFFSIGLQKSLSTYELPDVMVIYISKEINDGKQKGGDGYFYCDAQTGDLLGYSLGK